MCEAQFSSYGTVAVLGRTLYSPDSSGDLRRGPKEQDVRRFVAYWTRNRHTHTHTRAYTSVRRLPPCHRPLDTSTHRPATCTPRYSAVPFKHSSAALLFATRQVSDVHNPAALHARLLAYFPASCSFDCCSPSVIRPYCSPLLISCINLHGGYNISLAIASLGRLRPCAKARVCSILVRGPQ